MDSKKKFGFWSIVLLGINSIIGTGIFLLPGKAYSLVGTSSLYVYILAMFISGSIALCFAECAGLFKSNGAAYVYAKQAFGDFVGFEVGLMTYVIDVIAWAAMAVGFTTALGAVVPAVAAGFWNKAVIIGIIVVLTIVNLTGVNLVKYLDNIVTLGKLIPLFVFIAVGLFFIHGANFVPTPASQLTSQSFGSATLLIFYAFTGFSAIAVAAEDMRNPEKNIPRAIILVMIIVAIVYFLIQFVAIGILGTDLAGTKTPLADAMAVFMGPAGGIFITAGTLISIGGINIAASFQSPLGCLALAEQNMLPQFLKKRTENGVPIPAILLTAAITIPIALSGSFVFLASVSVISRLAQYIPTCLSIIVFRKRGMKSTFRVPWGPIIPLAATAASLWLLFTSDIKQIVIGLGALVIIAPFYFVMKAYNKKHNLQFTQAD